MPYLHMPTQNWKTHEILLQIIDCVLNSIKGDINELIILT